MTSPVLVTGNSSGLGLGLTRFYLQQSRPVYGLSRSGCPDSHPQLRDRRCDLADLDSVPSALEALVGDGPAPRLLVLNAGILGEIAALSETSMDAIRQIMDINVWSNKVILDWFKAQGHSPEQVVLISSGASVNGNKGWSGYALSKATLNMLGALYAHEFPDTHICALAPGLIHTRMQDYINDEVDAERFPSMQPLIAARGTAAMPDAETAAPALAAAMAQARRYPSGRFLDIRSMS